MLSLFHQSAPSGRCLSAVMINNDDDFGNKRSFSTQKQGAVEQSALQSEQSVPSKDSVHRLPPSSTFSSNLIQLFKRCCYFELSQWIAFNTIFKLLDVSSNLFPFTVDTVFICFWTRSGEDGARLVLARFVRLLADIAHSHRRKNICVLKNCKLFCC